MHVGIFWGFVLLTIGTANIVTGGLVQAVISWPLDGVLWTAVVGMQNVVAVIVLAAIGCAFWRRLVTRPAAAHAKRRRADHPGDDRRRRRDRAARPGVRGGQLRRRPRGVRRQRPGRPAPVARADASLEAAFAVLWWAHIALVAAFLVYLPFSKHLHIATSFFNIYFRKLAPRGELPAMDLEDEDRDVRAADAPGPRLEGPPRRLHLHRVRPLPGGLPGRTPPASRSTPRPSSWASARWRSRRSTGSTSSRTRRSCARPTGSIDTAPDPSRLAAPDRRRRDPVRRGLGLRDLRRLRRGLPGPHRARRQDRRAAPEPRPRGFALPGRAHRRVHEHGAGRQPVGPAEGDPDRLDEGPAVRGPDRRRARRRRSARRDRGPLLGRLRRGVRRAQPAGRPGVRDLPRRGRRPVRHPRPGGVVHRRPGPPDGQRLRLAAPRRGQHRDARPVRAQAAIVTACPHCFNTLGNEYGQLGGRYEVVHHSVFLRRLLAEGRLRTIDADGTDPAAARTVTVPRLVLHGPLQRRRRPAARRPRGRPGLELVEMERERQERVLLRRRRRPDVDGGDPRHADQRGAHPPGPRDRRRRRSPRTARSA